VISDGYHGRSEIALPSLSERESKKKTIWAYLGIYNVNIVKTRFSFLIAKLGDKLIVDLF